MNDPQRRCIAAVLLLAGILGLGGGSTLWAQSWFENWSWAHSDDAQRVQQQLAEATPIWTGSLDARPTAVIVRHAASVPTLAPTAPPQAVGPRTTTAPALTIAEATEPPAPTPTPVPLATADQVQLNDVEFEFLEPPEPGATARLTILLHDSADDPTPPVSVTLPADWLRSYSIFNTVPAATDDQTDDDGQRLMQFPALAPGADETIQLQVVATAETLAAPHITIGLAGGDAIGDAQPTTIAPHPRPGPPSVISIPELKVHSGVLPTDWEPPPFVVGELKGSANVSQGNTILIGHLTGAAGNVFAHLDQLQPGEKVTATSRGVDYDFVVSEVDTLPENDLNPLKPSDTPRLTLMTCAGVWNPITHDYNERLWVVAELPDQAAVTIAANQEKADQATATAEVEATLTATAQVSPTPTETPLPTATPVPTATPFAAEVALDGGLGNTRPNVDHAYGPPRGETSGKLAVYKQGSSEVHIWYSPDPQRAQAVVLIPPANARPPFDAAVQLSRPLLPRDAEPRADKPEGNAEYTVERFSSPTLAQALPASLFTGDGAQPGDLLVVYEKDGNGAIQRIVVGVGNDIDELLAKGRS
ncbi:MAG: sortase [Chloroflexi bacterium]|nr:sortase [Chloroflexota bacterium]